LGLGLTLLPLAAFDPATLPGQLVYGILIGSIYALVALGYTMVYGILKLINFAHGEVFMLGAYVALFISWALGYTPEEMQRAPMPSSLMVLGLMLVGSMVVCGLVGVLIEFMAYRPMRNQPRISALITAIGVSLLLQYGGALFLPVSPPPVIREEANPVQGSLRVWIQKPPEPLLGQYTEAEREFEAAKDAHKNEQYKIRTNGTTEEKLAALSDKLAVARTRYSDLERQIQPKSIRLILPHGLLVMAGTSLVLMLFLRWLVMKTKIGRGMRAVSQDFDSAALMGVNVNTVVFTTFLIGSALAGAGAMMYALFQGLTISTFFGVAPGLKGFVAAVVGGIGNIPGAVLGGLIMGVAEALVIWSGLDMFKDAFGFVILIIVLLILPKGLLGSNKVEKV